MQALVYALRETPILGVCIRDGLPPRQHVTQPTGVAETVFDEDPEAEEAAVALDDDPFLHQGTPSRSAPDLDSSLQHESVSGDTRSYCIHKHSPRRITAGCTQLSAYRSCHFAFAVKALNLLYHCCSRQKLFQRLEYYLLTTLMHVTSMLSGGSPPEGKENGAPEEHSSTNSYPPPPGSDAVPTPAQPQPLPMKGLQRGRSEGLAALLDSPDLPHGRAGPYALRRHLMAPHKPISQREPSLAHLAATNSADLGTVSNALTHARKQQGKLESDSPKADQSAQVPMHAAANSPKARATAPAPLQQPFAGFAPSGSAQPAGGGEQASPGRLLSPFSMPNPSGHDPMDAFAHLPEGLRIQLQAPGAEDMSRTNSLVYNQVRTSTLYLHPSMWSTLPWAAPRLVCMTSFIILADV